METERTGGTDGRYERHHHNSKPDTSDSEPCLETGAGGEGAPTSRAADCPMPLPLVLRACRDLPTYAGGDVRHWHQLVAAANGIRPMLGISPSGWEEARAAMGDITAAVVLSCILQRADRIRSPGGYLRCLARKARDGHFSPWPMVMALLNADPPPAES